MGLSEGGPGLVHGLHDDLVAWHLHEDTVEPQVHVGRLPPPFLRGHLHMLETEPGRQQDDQAGLAPSRAKHLLKIVS